MDTPSTPFCAGRRRHSQRLSIMSTTAAMTLRSKRIPGCPKRLGRTFGWGAGRECASGHRNRAAGTTHPNPVSSCTTCRRMRDSRSIWPRPTRTWQLASLLSCGASLTTAGILPHDLNCRHRHSPDHIHDHPRAIQTSQDPGGAFETTHIRQQCKES